MSRILKVVLVAGGLAGAGLVGYGAGSMGAFAQGGPGTGPGGGPGMMMERGPDGPMGPRAWRDGARRGEQRMHRGERHGHGGPFAGFFINRDNKNLSNDDVRKIAEAGLLWFGERNWRIGEVTDAGSRMARFTLTTENGGVIATFEMNRDTGRMRRVS